MRKILLLLFLTAAAAAAFSLEITVPESALPGGVITVAADTAGVELSFGMKDEIFSASSTFELEIEGETVYAGLLGVPSTLEPGIYSVFGEGFSSSIIITGKEFIHEDIPLSSSMSSLRQSDDIRKAEQWRNLLVILKTVDTGHVFEEGRLNLPVNSYLHTSSFYGDRRRFLYDDGSSARSIHNGIDYSAEPGTPVYAAGDGRVVFSGDRIISGNTVVIEHLPGVYSLYYHMNSLAAGEGDWIAAGDQVGTVGATGLATGAHLHWEIRVAGVAVDPAPLIDGGMIDKDFILGKIEQQ